MSNDTEWRLRERVVAYLEAAMDPHARVQTDVRLPALGTPEIRRKCEILIRTGTPPRETLSLVEVQRRKRPYGIESLNSHYAKMREVGAQHLIAVASGFTKDVIVRAGAIGPYVRLVTLREVEDQESWPLNFADGVMRGTKVTGPRIHKFEWRPFGLGRTVRLYLRKAQFVRPGDPLGLSFDDVIKQSLFRDAQAFLAKPPGSCLMLWMVSTDRDGVGIMIDGRPYPFELFLVMTVQIDHAKIPMVIESYEQLGHDDTLGWVARTVAPSNEFETTVVLVPGPDGRSYLGAAIVPEGAQHSVFLHYTDEPLP